MSALGHPQDGAGFFGIAAVAILAYAINDLGHEILGHGLATLLPLGVQAVSVSTIGLSTTASSPIVAAAGPLLNLLLAATLLLAGSSALSPAWRYFFWLFGATNAFGATAYLLYSAILGSGDVAVVFDALAPSRVWRLPVAIAGLALYAGAVFVSWLALRRLLRAGVVAERNADRYCTLSYWVGGALLTLGAVFNPVSPLYILTSGAATGFGAMAGMNLLPVLLKRQGVGAEAEAESLRIGRGWLVAGAVAGLVFVGIFGPGVSLPLFR
ncbi:MAG TPA: hypothetical protein VN783_00545 [Thermoanaerobaculia bacterium]|nr:hypothetical protein [Thermoanaerobaculia bacterium]